MCVASAHADSPIGEYALVTSLSPFASIYTRERRHVFNNEKAFDFSRVLWWTWVLDVCDRHALVILLILVFASIYEQKRFRNILMRAITM